MRKYLALKADAGSGKTFALSVRFIALILQDEKISQILAITFTKKATNEMKSRIISIFSDIANAYGKTVSELRQIKHFEELRELSKMLPTSQNEDENLIHITKLASLKFNDFLSNELKIMTFDSFFTMILRQFSLNLGLMPDFNTGENIQNELLEHIQNKFSDEQIYNIVSLMKQSGASENSIFNSLEQIAKSNILMPASKAPNTDFATKFNEIVDLWEEAVQNNQVKPGNFGLEKITQNREKNADLVVEKIFSKTITKFDEPNFAQKLLNLQNLMREYYYKYEAYKISNTLSLAEFYQNAIKQVAQNTGKISFENVVNLVYELLCKNKISVDWLYFKLDADIKNILIDEFQDTSVYQYKIMLPLINEIVSGLGQNGIGSFFYVGDVKQSIYKFRDAKKELFDTLALKFKQIQILPLDTNYRSKSEIVDFVNNTFRDTINGFEQDQKSVKNGGFVEICDFETFEGENKFDEFLELLGKKVRFFVDNGALLNEIAILCQNNKDCELIKDYLQLNNINAYINAKSLLINTMPVRLVLEYLRYCLFGDNAYGGALEIVLGKKVARLNLNIKDLPSTLKYLANQLKIDEFEPNLMKLYELSLKYKNIIEFVYDIENSEEISANLITDGLNLMTIHKSKGLEFENVIVCDCLGKPPADKNKFLMNYDEEKDIWEIRFKSDSFEILGDEKYLSLKQKIKNLEKDELINRLYVAFTRAKSSLIILAKSNPNGKNPSYLREYISNKIPVKVLDLPNAKFGKFEPNLKPNLDLKSNLKLNLKPFEIVAKQNILENQQNNYQDNIENIYFGNALHFMIEMSDFNAQNNQNAFYALKNKFGAFLSEKQLEDIKFRAKQLIKNDKFNQIIQNKKILKEQSIVFDENLYRFDLLCMGEDEIVVIDYKSGKMSDLYLNQVSKYIQMLKNLYPQQKISGFIVYLWENEIKFIQVPS